MRCKRSAIRGLARRCAVAGARARRQVVRRIREVLRISAIAWRAASRERRSRSFEGESRAQARLSRIEDRQKSKTKPRRSRPAQRPAAQTGARRNAVGAGNGASLGGEGWMRFYEAARSAARLDRWVRLLVVLVGVVGEACGAGESVRCQMPSGCARSRSATRDARAMVPACARRTWSRRRRRQLGSGGSSGSGGSADRAAGREPGSGGTGGKLRGGRRWTRRRDANASGARGAGAAFADSGLVSSAWTRSQKPCSRTTLASAPDQRRPRRTYNCVCGSEVCAKPVEQHCLNPSAGFRSSAECAYSTAATSRASAIALETRGGVGGHDTGCGFSCRRPSSR